MEHRFLLTYDDGEYSRYAWFESEEEMDDFIESKQGIEINDKMEILGVRDIK